MNEEDSERDPRDTGKGDAPLLEEEEEEAEEEEEEEGLLKADAVNEEDPERDRATQEEEEEEEEEEEGLARPRYPGVEDLFRRRRRKVYSKLTSLSLSPV